ncbi:MAG TPA: DegT/DnrJ/EryC1/StrS family aminotransferase [Candidatus Avipropionibacterium avicola]|uniref:DegT/DnrJ/EryC1/StrS family aminotransferase n=1 Tax=Candidatus Avipropionibacterium avicola TaxID=2840701 RepID=A0A9D1KLA5_9ACTN|nr:DegT/DnrJ/EryC1/StrS family aminotransferase [Candidatus Avipropionibacterium avicola]
MTTDLTADPRIAGELASAGGQPVRTTPFPSVGDLSGRRIGEEEIAAVTDVLRSGKLNCTVGTRTKEFEDAFGELYGVSHVAASSSGTSALHLAVAAVNPNPGDEIITTGLSDAGTVLPILAQNAIPVFADVDPASGLLDVESVRSKITRRTKAIIAVHLYGQPAPVEELRALADEKGIHLIEDCAQAYLTRTPSGRLAGTVGHLGCFSLQQSKHITAGDGGLTISNDPELGRRARLFADKAWPRDTDERTHLFLGLNYRMTELQAALAHAQLGKLEQVVEDRRRQANKLVEVVNALPGLSTAPYPEGTSWWLFPIFVDAAQAGGDSVAYGKHLGAEGVGANPGYIGHPLYLNPVLSEARTYGDSGYPIAEVASTYAPGLCPVTEDLIGGGTMMVLGWNENFTDEDVADIATAIQKVHRALTAG